MTQTGVVQAVVFVLALAFWGSSSASAHCDTMNGPVVKAGQQALDRADISHALIWVKPSGEAEIRTAFNTAMVVRKLGGEAKALADRYFFETLVRVHRAGEGAPYTGLKDEESVPEPGIAAAEKALADGSAAHLSGQMGKELQRGVLKAFERVRESASYKTGDVEGGRQYVEAYVKFIHYIERLHQTIGFASDEHRSAVEHLH